MAMAKADMYIAQRYAWLIKDSTLRQRIFNEILSEYQLTRRTILKVTRQKEILDNSPIIQKSIRLRNPYTDPLNYIQAELLKRRTDEERQANRVDEELDLTILLSINGIAAAMQETG